MILPELKVFMANQVGAYFMDTAGCRSIIAFRRTLRGVWYL
jgi:hypothetical protein